jgi:osmoprotectant transport system permease protein
VKAGKIDGYVEYSGTAFTGILQEKPLNDARLVSEKLARDLSRKI